MVRYQETPFGRDVDISNSCRSVDTYRRTQAIHLISEHIKRRDDCGLVR